MVGVDISDRSIKVAEVVGRREPSLRTVCWSALAPNLMRRGVIQDVSLVAAALRQTFASCSPVPVSSKMVVASIPETQSFVRVLDLPQMSDAEVEEAVQWAVRQHIPFDLDRVYLDWQPLPAVGRDRRRRVLVGTVQRDVVDPLLRVLDGAGLRVVALEMEAQAIVRCLLPRQAKDVYGVLVLDLGATTTNVIFFDGGVMRFTTSVPLGGDDLTKQLAQTLKLEPSLAASKKAVVGLQEQSGESAMIALSLREAMMELLQRVEKVVREMTAQLPGENIIRAILLSGGAANLPGIRDVFAEVFPGIPVQMGNPWTNIAPEEEGDKPKWLSPQDANHFVTSVGLGLRREEYI